ncbi:DUF2946 family protein [Meiothermus taiwanensis]|jgi:hypothetical protein|uniref:DUF2946 domain-containing protein n=2 Tax=Meiothermus taiwanensis TaxID=172827 RepID=A0A399DWY8_9DEIN|nr:DUF2946 family protein [Meiothermus taiwanensis]AWR86594.1 hypothetical protein Mtai_v1c13520 [Meiothermus taiwanensis WR-220]RIH74480.1 hypothetical protein Mcate_02703 [Meiothermus taiwanensis]
MRRGKKSGTPRALVALGLMGLVWLTSLLFGLRGVVMFSIEPTATQPHENAHHHSEKTHHHLEHCPLCVLHMLLPDLTPALNGVLVASLVARLWSGAQHARDEFLKAVAARGPPLATHSIF